MLISAICVVVHVVPGGVIFLRLKGTVMTVAFSPQFIGGCKRWHSRELQRLISKHGFRVLGAYNQTHTLGLTLPPRLRKRKRIRKNRCKPKSNSQTLEASAMHQYSNASCAHATLAFAEGPMQEDPVRHQTYWRDCGRCFKARHGQHGCNTTSLLQSLKSLVTQAQQRPSFDLWHGLSELVAAETTRRQTGQGKQRTQQRQKQWKSQQPCTRKQKHWEQPQHQQRDTRRHWQEQKP